MTTNDSKRSHRGLPGSNEYMAFRLKTVWQQRFKICNRKGRLSRKSSGQSSGEYTVVGKQQLFFRGAGRRRDFTIATLRYHGNTSVSQYGA